MMLRVKSIPVGLESHPYMVRSVSDLSAELQSQALKHLPPGEQISSIFVNPRSVRPASDHRPRFHPENALLFTANGVLSIYETDLLGNFPPPTFIAAASLVSMQVSLVLLYGRLEVIGMHGDRRTELIMEYHTIGHEELQPSLHHFLSLSANRLQEAGFDPSLEKNAWQEVEKLPVKYGNGLSIFALIPGEHLAGVAFQPGISVPTRLGFRRRIAYPVLLALTNFHLIILGEELVKKHADYSWIITYCPLSMITAIEIIPEQHYQRLVIQLKQGQVELEREVKVNQATAQSILALWNQARSTNSR